ncbi:acidic mammalian chitinase-like [Periplaneta americana]|uniref:Chitinase n=1 Tax=Periplaneta americana TaxID=6978 RepID=A0A059WIM0_PERAM|nr:chitinase [Periplaneta americana]AVA17389.1 putative Per a 12 allergen variant [Periplaneta americana]
MKLTSNIYVGVLVTIALILQTCKGFIRDFKDHRRLQEKGDDRAVFCYYGSWASYRWGVGTFNVDNIDTRLCSHIVYAFTGLRDGVIVSLDQYNDLEENWGKGLMKKFTTLARNNGIKSLLAIGGWNEGSTKYSEMAATQEGREKFADSVVSFVEKQGFNGLDLDWEYPARRGGVPEDKDHFTLLLKVLSEKLHARGHLITIAVSADPKTIANGYDIPNVGKYADYITVMTFDYHTPSSDTVTGLNSPLDSLPQDTGYNKELNVKNSINTWLKGGAPPNKLLLGTPLYGRTYRLWYEDQHDLGSPILGPGDAGLYTQEAGFLAYYEICSNPDWNIVWNATSSVLYAYKTYQWLSYDDPNTITIKTKWALEKNLGGVMVWSLESDDFHGNCGKGTYPLLTTVNKALQRV